MAFAPPWSFILLLSVLSLPFSAAAQTSRNQPLGSSLIAENGGSYWASPSGDFAFGFQQVGKGGYLLAVWFNKIPDKTIVWSANGNNLAPRGSIVMLTTDGEFVLNDQKGKRLWKADFAGLGVAYAAMLDSGNFVLAGEDSVNLWESFDLPTDTILPTKVMEKRSKLVARYAEKKHSNGRFQFSLQSDGNLVLETRTFPLNTANFVYWSSKTVGTGFQMIFNESGSIYLTANNGSIVKTISSAPGSSRDFYQRAILEYDGVFRHYVYPKNPTTANDGNRPKAWTPLSSFIPSNICTAVTEARGSGACGFNSYCKIGDDKRPKCQCPDGYSFIDPDDVMKGCKQNFLSQSCDPAFPETDNFYLHSKLNIDWPQSDYEYFQGQTEDWCGTACLGDCFCAVAIYRTGECWKKKIPLSNGRMGPSVNRIALIKIRNDNTTSNPSGTGSTLIFVGSVLLSSSVSLNLLSLLAAFLFAFRFNYRKPKVLQEHRFMPGVILRSFTYEELQKATNGFKKELGSGGFATVYKGALESDDEMPIAVKRLNMTVKGGDQFDAEVRAIGRTNHRNLVQLLGFCNEGEHRLLVYELMANGSVASFLFGGSRPNWHQRMQIAIGTARGLFYLHEECKTQIIHCDIKLQNILLDDNLTAKIADFGLAKLLNIEQTRTMTAIRGTKGYVAPEWFRSTPITVKVDVYSFGIVLLELICCRKNFVAEVEDENQMILADWVSDCYKYRNLDLLVANDEEAMDDIKRVEKFLMIAIWCTQADPSLRPSMKKVVQMMEETVEVAAPPDPSSFFSSF